jgi:molybdopterin/thiamine biosynthesis adenylyltransferase
VVNSPVSPTDADSCRARIIDPDDRQALDELRANSHIEFVDRWHAQETSLRRLRPAPAPELITEPRRWAYYPWRRAVVSILGPRAFRAVRLDRNRNLITSGEQDRLGRLRIGVVGLSAGHAIAHTLALEGLCGELRLADFDGLELSNLNRVAATVFDLGVNKATVAARRIAELDPYLPVQVLTSGLTEQAVDGFLDGLDIVVEECDSLDMKAVVREAARARRLPVLMATSDRGLVDVERYDLEPRRPILHGLLGDIDIAELHALTSRDKVQHVLRILDGAGLSPRGAASLIEVGNTLSTWPQLAGEVALGATAVVEAVRRIGLRETLPSGRVRVDVARALDHLHQPTPAHERRTAPEWTDPVEPLPPPDVVAAAAIRAPSGGNAQPWHIEANEESITVRLAPEHTSTMDVCFRGSAVAVGAALFNARVAAAAHNVLGSVDIREDGSRAPLHATLRFADGDDRDLARLYEPMLVRETNRNRGAAGTVSAEFAGLLEAAARREGARLQLLCTRPEIETAAAILAAADRIRYLTPRLHEEMIAELRWPEDDSPDSGIDVRSLELDSAELLSLDILRRREVMGHLADWDAGAALGDDTRDRITASSALAVVSVRGGSLTDYARGGSAVEAVWINAQQHGLAVQPISPVFLYAHDDHDLSELSSAYAPSLRRLQREFRELTHTEPDEAQVLVFRLSDASRTSVRSRRRNLSRVGPI